MQFTPPPVPEGVDVIEHVWSSRQAIRSWYPRDVVLEEIVLQDDLRFELATHPRLQHSSGVTINSLWGMSMTFSPFAGRSYTITYREV